MLDRIESAVRRWEVIRPAHTIDLPPGKSDEIVDWIDRMVCPVVAELMTRPDFRALARWSLDNLGPSCQTKARRLVDAIDQDLRGLARDLSNVLTEGYDPNSPSNVAISADPARRFEKADFNALQNQLELIHSGPWRDLCCEYDYFGPAVDLNLKEPPRNLEGKIVQLADFSTGSQPQWRSPGDYVYRCLETRINYWRELLQTLVAAVRKVIGGGHDQTDDRFGPFRHANQQLRTHLSELRAICRDDPQVPLREKAMALVQIYAAFRPDYDLPWLGQVAGQRRRALELRWRLESRGDLSIADASASALAELRTIYRESNIALVLQRMVQERSLCLLKGQARAEAYWKGKLIEVDWDIRNRAWIFLFELGRRAKSGRGIDTSEDLGISLKDARRDFPKLFPRELIKEIRKENFVFKMHLPPDQIYVAQLISADVLEEITGNVRLTSIKD